MKINQSYLEITKSKTKALSSLKKKIESSRLIDFAHGDVGIHLSQTCIAEISKLSAQKKVYSYGSPQGNIHLIDYLANDYGVDSENIFIGLGVKSLCLNLFRLLLKQNDSVLILGPNWLTYQHQLDFLGIDHLTVLPNDDFLFPVIGIQEIINKKKSIKMIVVSNPNNPTGGMLKQNELSDLFELACEYNLVLVMDEVFSDLVFENKEYNSIKDLYSDRFKSILDNVVVINSGSKSYGVSGFRVGYLVADSKIIEHLAKYANLDYNNVPDLLQLAYLHELKNRVNHNKQIKLIANRYYAVRDAIDYSKHLMLNTGGGGITVFPSFTKHSDLGRNADQIAFDLLEKEQVAVVSGCAFGFPKHLRLAFSHLNKNDIERGINKIDKLIDSYEK